MSLSVVNAVDIGAVIDATTTFVNNTSDIVSGKRRKEDEAKKKAQEEADAIIIENQTKFTELCKSEYHKHKVPFAASSIKEVNRFMRTTKSWDAIVRDTNKGKFETRDCALWLSSISDFDYRGFQQETAKYAD